MALVKSKLSKGLEDAFKAQLAKTSGDIKVPRVTDELAAALGAAYDAYASAGTVHETAATAVGGPSKVESALKGADYFDGWEQGLTDYWTPALFGGGTYVDAAATVVSGISGCKTAVRALLPDPAGKLSDPVGIELHDFCESLAGVLDDHTKKVTSDLTDKSSGSPVGPAPVS